MARLVQPNQERSSYLQNCVGVVALIFALALSSGVALAQKSFSSPVQRVSTNYVRSGLAPRPLLL